MTALRSKWLAIALAFSVSLFVGSWPTLLARAAALPPAPASFQHPDQGPGQTGEFEGENVDNDLAANNVNDREVENEVDVQEGPEIQEDRQEDIQKDLQEDLQQDLHEDLREGTQVPPQL
jgi:hypothetical protein